MSQEIGPFTLGGFLTAAARRFLPRAARETLPERRPGETRYIYIPQQTAGVWVTEENAIQISAVWACVSVISKGLAASTWEVFEEKPNGDREMRRDGRLFRLLNTRPNPEATAFSVRESLAIAALLWQGAYAEIERDASARPVALWPLHPDRVTPDRTEDGELVYRVTNQRQGETILPARDVYHIHGPGIDSLVGYRIARVAARGFGHNIAAETFGAAFYGNGATMEGVFESDQNLTVEQGEKIRERLDERHGGSGKAHKALVLTGGLKYHQTSVEPEKAQFIETRQHLIEEVCRWFGVPPHKIAHLLRATFNNIEQQGLEFVRDSLTPWAERMRQEAEAKLLPAINRRIATRIDLDWLAEGDAKSKAEADAILVRNGIKNRNEVRRRRGLNTIPDGEKFTVEANMTTLEKVGEEPPKLEPPAEDETGDESGEGEGEEPPFRVVET